MRQRQNLTYFVNRINNLVTCKTCQRISRKYDGTNKGIAYAYGQKGMERFIQDHVTSGLTFMSPLSDTSDN